MKVLMADLTHDYVKVANETMPLSVGLIASYVRSSNDAVDFSIFKYPESLIAEIKNNQHGVLMLSNYVWNEELVKYVFKLQKEVNRNVLTVCGGPNVSVDSKKRELFLRENDFIDLYVMGEGEIPSREIIEKYVDFGFDIERLKSALLQNVESVDSGGVYVKSYNNADRANVIRELDSIPSPYLSGLMDDFFDGVLSPIIESTRGCPFKCSFCVQGTEHFRNVRRFSIDRSASEIEYISNKISERSPNIGYLRIADSNFGMYDKDVELSKVINKCKNKSGWPSFVDATTGKNRKDSILQTVVNLDGSLVMYNSVQSLSPVVLNAINRTNIKADVIQEIQAEAREQGIQTLTETILGLPGETLASHFEGISKVIGMGIKQFTNYQCMLLKGSHMESDKYRNEFQFSSHFRVLPRGFGMYDGQKVVEVEEIVTSTSTLSFDDYLSARKYHLILIVFFNGEKFRSIFAILERYNIDVVEWLMCLLDNVDDSEISEYFDQFVDETKGELFETREQCVDYYLVDCNFKNLIDGNIGGNLIMKYYSVLIFYAWDKVVSFAFLEAKKVLVNRGVGINVNLFCDLERYVANLIAHGNTAEDVLSKKICDFDYDVVKFLSEWGGGKSFSEYKADSQLRLEFSLSDDNLTIMRNAIDTYGFDLNGLSKLVTRIQYQNQLREVVIASDD